MIRLRTWLATGLLAISLAPVGWAQENAELTGTVTDPSGAVVPNAKVTATNTAIGEVRTATSNGAGLYDFAAMHIGTYTLVVEAPGFRSYNKTGIVMNVAATVREDVPLTVGGNNQTVTVAANALHLQTETNEVSNLITGEQISQLATNGRNVTSLTTLGTGVSAGSMMPSFNGVTAQGSNFAISFNGMRPDHNDWLIDGGEAYDRGSGGKFDLMPSPDALAEFQTLDSNYSPDYGIASGGTVIMVLKSGTKRLHGGLWEFNRNDDFDADNYFSKLSSPPTPQPELRLNIFGGDIGGPVVIPRIYPIDKSRTYFFVDEEWRRYIQGANPSPANTVPVVDIPASGAALNYAPWNEAKALPAGICNTTWPCVPKTNDPNKLALYAQDGLTAGNPFPGNVIPANLIDPNAVRFMSTGAIPAPNSGSVSLPQYTASPTQPTYVREDVVRIDHDITDKMHLMGHWIHDQMSQTIFPTMWSGDSYDTTGDVFGNPSWASVIKLTQTISPSLLNETSLDVNGNTISITPAGIYAEPSGWNAGSYFTGNNALNRLPQVAFGAPLGTTWTINYWPWHNSFLDYQIRDDFSWNIGKHQFKFGGSYMREDKNQQFQQNTEGNYAFGTDFSGDSYLNFLLGFADSFQQLQALLTDHWINNTYSAYGQDNWRIIPRLTLNLGVRYDALPHVYEKNNRLANFVPADYNPADAPLFNADGSLDAAGPGFSQPAGAAAPFYLNGLQLAGVNRFPRGVVENFWGTVQPRVGFAYDLFGSGKTVLRGGAGLFFERIQGNDAYDADTNPPFAYQPQASDVYFSNPSTSDLTGGTATTPTFPASVVGMAYYYPDPATFQYSLGVQHQLAPSVVMVTQYVGSTGWHQQDIRAINTLPLGDLTDRQGVATGSTNANLHRIYQGYSGINQEETATNSTYNSLQAALRMENRHGLTVQLAYTWSHEIDIQSGDETSFPLAGSSGQVSNPFNLKYDRGSGEMDRRNIFNANFIYHLPFYRQGGNDLQREALGGWEISGITQAESGSPVNVSYSPDVLGLSSSVTNRPDKVGSVSGAKTQKAWFNARAFAAPTAAWDEPVGPNGGFGNAGKDSVVGPGLANWNLSLFKTFPITTAEGPRFELRFESFNTFNHTEFNGIDTGFTDANFGQVTNTYDPRELQFGGKFLF
ncbi:MAG: carboxypeptidase regulatory-like domain-containing protein [Acidobacteriaceae bacterium]